MLKFLQIGWLAILVVSMPVRIMSQSAVADSARVKVQGEGITSFTFARADLKPEQLQTITRKEHDGSNHTFSGISFADLFALGGFTIADKVKGKLLRNYVLVEAADGYKVVFSLAELDTTFSGNKIILASKMDGRPLAAEKGPFQVIVQDDKKLARCVRMVTSITIRSALE